MTLSATNRTSITNSTHWTLNSFWLMTISTLLTTLKLWLRKTRRFMNQTPYVLKSPFLLRSNSNCQQIAIFISLWARTGQIRISKPLLIQAIWFSKILSTKSASNPPISHSFHTWALLRIRLKAPSLLCWTHQALSFQMSPSTKHAAIWLTLGPAPISSKTTAEVCHLLSRFLGSRFTTWKTWPSIRTTPSQSKSIGLTMAKLSTQRRSPRTSNGSMSAILSSQWICKPFKFWWAPRILPSSVSKTLTWMMKSCRTMKFNGHSALKLLTIRRPFFKKASSYAFQVETGNPTPSTPALQPLLTSCCPSYLPSPTQQRLSWIRLLTEALSQHILAKVMLTTRSLFTSTPGRPRTTPCTTWCLRLTTSRALNVARCLPPSPCLKTRPSLSDCRRTLFL